MVQRIEFAEDRMRVRFDDFGLESYQLFLRCKQLPEYEVSFDRERETYAISAPARFANLLGMERPSVTGARLPFCGRLYSDQRQIVEMMLDAERFACWGGCGYGKTLIALELARQVVSLTKGRFLLVTFHEIIPQWLDMVREFYGADLKLEVLESRGEMRRWCREGASGVAITNYEKFNPGTLEDQVVNELRHLAGIGLDEASRLKGGGGKQKWALIKSAKGIRFKYTFTATPAPNDLMEFASQAAFLEKMRTETDIIWTYFTRDPQTQKWTVKPHARKAFFAWMASWSIYVNNPKRYGWRLDQPDVPPPTYKTVEISMTKEQREALQRLSTDKATGQVDLFGSTANSAVRRLKLSQIAKGFRYQKDGDGRRVERIESDKPSVVAEIVAKEHAAGEQVLVWTVFDAESEILEGLLKPLQGVALITGATPDEDRVRILNDFRRGEIRVLISRARMLGFGMNFQCCGAMVFSGWTDSFEDLYQAIRRAVRHGQQKSVRVYFPIIRDLEGDVFDNIRRKEAAFERSIAEMEENYLRAHRALKGGVA